jgi:hypothetical protein
VKLGALRKVALFLSRSETDSNPRPQRNASACTQEVLGRLPTSRRAIERTIKSFRTQAKKGAAAKLAAERAQEKARVADEARLNRERAELEKTLQELTGG